MAVEGEEKKEKKEKKEKREKREKESIYKVRTSLYHNHNLT